MANSRALCFNGENDKWGRDVALVEIPANTGGFVATWPPSANDGKRRIGYYKSTGVSNADVANFDNVFFPYAGIDIDRGFSMGVYRKWHTLNHYACSGREEQQLPVWRQKWDALADSVTCPTRDITISRSYGMKFKGELIDLEDPEHLKMFMRARRGKWADKFAEFWQLEISIACGTPTIPTALREVMFGPIDPNAPPPPRMSDPSFDMIPYLVRRYKWDEKKQNFVRRPKGKSHDLICPQPILDAMKNLGACASLDNPPFQPTQPSKDDDLSGLSAQQWVFQTYRSIRSIDDWMQNHGALVVLNFDAYKKLGTDLKPLLSRDGSLKAEATVLDNMLNNGGPTRQSVERHAFLRNANRNVPVGEQRFQLGISRIRNDAPPLPGDEN